MSQVEINKAKEPQGLPIFEEIARRLEDVRRRAFELFERRGRELGHALDDWLKAERELLGWPAAELKRIDDGYELELTLPGFETKDIQVTATPESLIIQAASEKTREGGKADVLWTEFVSNDVYRRFELPECIDIDKVTANPEKGILRVRVPRQAATRETTSAATAAKAA